MDRVLGSYGPGSVTATEEVEGNEPFSLRRALNKGGKVRV